MLKNYLYIFLISMVPLVELRLAVPASQALELPMLPSLIICMIGNLLPMPFIYLFARRVLEWGQGKPVIGGVFRFFLEKGHNAGRKLTEKAGRTGSFIALMLFVGIPVPGTGAWTGTLAASILELGIKTTTVAVALGVFMAGLIMMAASAVGLSLIG